MKNYLLVMLLLPIFAFSQQKTQTIKGRISDIESQQVLEGVSVFISDNNQLITTTNANGDYVLENVPVGRVNVQTSYIGYASYQSGYIILSSGKEMTLNISLTQKVNEVKEVVVSAGRSNRPVNDAMVVSARSFTIAETNRFAGSINDPGRVALNYAGVMTNQDNNNDVIVRGNSPVGVLWRLEGIDVPNVNHFSRPGSSGGGISALSPFLMGATDFSTGAFPAEYGNALSSVFDVRYRPGNTSRHEFTFRIGLIGLNFGAEGPFNKAKNTSYLFNYRYSTLGILNKMGVYVVGANTANDFQDLSFNLLVKNTKKTKINIFALGGISSEITFAKKDSTKWEKYTDKYQTNFLSNLGVLGISWTQQIGQKSYIKTVIAGTYNETKDYDDTLDNRLKWGSVYYSHYRVCRLALHSFYNHKFSAKVSLKVGVEADAMNYYYNERKSIDSLHIKQTLLDTKGYTSTIQPYTQVKYSPYENSTFIVGAHAVYLLLNNTYSIEPRFSYQQRLGKNLNHNLAVSYGWHAMALPIGSYLTQFSDGKGGYYQPNKNLQMVRSHHIIGSYGFSFLKNFRIRSEVYAQFQQGLPIGKTPGSTYMLFNDRKGFAQDSLTNNGKGMNYGIDFTFEKIYSKNWFALMNATVFKSYYQLADGRKFSTMYDNLFGLTVMGGYEFKFKKNNSLELTIRLQYSGGFRYTPIDEAASKLYRTQVERTNEAFTSRVSNYFRPDFRVAYRENRKKFSWLLSLDLGNFVNYKNVRSQIYDKDLNALSNTYMVGILPILAFEIDFFAPGKKK